MTSVYHNDKPEYVTRALESMVLFQTIVPNEIILVVDGPIPNNLMQVISNFETGYSDMVRVIRLPKNKGLGNALRIGVKSAKYDIIARMDSDDVSLPDRFEKQLAYLITHPECDIVGGQISEFIDDESHIVGKRLVPFENEEIYNWMKKRCPFNHMTVMFKKDSVLSVGNYQDWHYNEDYYLWIRMAEAGCHFANLPDTLVNVRVGKDMYARRGGWKYFKSEKGLQDYMLRHKMISISRYSYNVLGRFTIQVLLPNWLRAFVFQKLFRK